MMMMQSAGASLFDAEGKPDIASNATLKVVIELYAKLVNDGILTQVNDWDEYAGTLTGGAVSSTINGCWIMASIQSAADQSGKWAITNMPKLDGVSGATNYSNNGGSSWAASSTSKDTALAFDFLKSTFAGSVDFYADILPSSGALATYLPATRRRRLRQRAAGILRRRGRIREDYRICRQGAQQHRRLLLRGA